MYVLQIGRLELPGLYYDIQMNNSQLHLTNDFRYKIFFY